MKPAEAGAGAMGLVSSKALGRLRNARVRLRSAAWWPWAKRLLTLLFLAGVGVLLIIQARSLDWAQVTSSLWAYAMPTLILAGVLSIVSHVLFSSFDLLGRRYTGHQVSRTKVLAVAAICYAFTLNLGALIGGVAFRYRLYSRLGLENGVITRIYLLSVVSNWLAYLLLLGSLLAFRQVSLPFGWDVGAVGLQWLGALLLLLSLGYLVSCGVAHGRSWNVRGQEITLPSLPLALGQLLLSLSNWLVMGTIIYVLLHQKLEFPLVLATLLLSGAAGVITHVPAGLGVLEAVFITVLGRYVPVHELLAALLAYRALYYLTPMGLALVLYGALEAHAARTA